MNGYIKIATYSNDEYGLLSEFVSDDEILFAYTKFYNNKYTYEFVSETINNKLKDLYLNDRCN